MRGGQYVNNWRMAQLHAQEAPARVKELEAWGAVFDRTPDGRIFQRNFGGHRYPRAGIELVLLERGQKIRVSVCRSKLLKISAITSCASRRRVCERLT